MVTRLHGARACDQGERQLAGDFELPDLDNDDQFGQSSSGLGDFDGDGVPDLLVGVDGDDDGGSLTGAAYVLFLDGPQPSSASIQILDNDGPTVVSIAPSLDGDELGPVDGEFTVTQSAITADDTVGAGGAEGTLGPATCAERSQLAPCP